MNKEIQHALIKKFRKTIYAKFLSALDDYQLIEENDKICVCISGGKDSFLLAICLEEIKEHGNIPFDLEFVTLDPGYPSESLEIIKDTAKKLEIDLKIISVNIFSYVKTLDDNPCYMCARMRRGNLYAHAKELGCNKIALGHHLNDVIETFVLGFTYSNEITFMRPKLISKNFEGMTLIRPLYKVKEEDIIKWQTYHDLKFIHCSCPLSDGNTLGKRAEVKQIIKDLKNYNPEIEDNLFRSCHNLNLATIIQARKGDEIYSFNDIFEKEQNERKN